jgi:hypothetical protein
MGTSANFWRMPRSRAAERGSIGDCGRDRDKSRCQWHRPRTAQTKRGSPERDHGTDQQGSDAFEASAVLAPDSVYPKTHLQRHDSPKRSAKLSVPRCPPAVLASTQDVLSHSNACLNSEQGRARTDNHTNKKCALKMRTLFTPNHSHT